MRRSFCTLLCLLWLAADSTAHIGISFKLSRHGSASVYYSENGRIACIIDGGQKGELSRVKVEGKPFLEGLLEAGCRELVISCSHPHSDHAGGLRELVASDTSLTKFDRIIFVDSSYADSKSLIKLFRKAHPDYPADKVARLSAEGRNAFAGLFPEGSSLQVENLVYTPRPGTTEHGHAIIHHIVLERNGRKTVIVDFDDADSDLVEEWAMHASTNPIFQKADYVAFVGPHHGSDEVDIAPLLNPRIRVDFWIITSVPGNQYGHPGVLNLIKVIGKVGVGNVIYPAVQGDAVFEAGAKPEVTPEAKAAINARLLKPRRDKIDQKLRQIEEMALGQAPSSSDRKRYDALIAEWNTVNRLIERYGGGTSPPNRSSAVDFSSRFTPHSSESILGRTLVGRFEEIKTRSSAALAGARLAAVPSTNIHLAANFHAGVRAARFNTSLRIYPIWGGIMLGNSIHPSSGQVQKARFLVTNNLPSIELLVKQEGQLEECRFEEMTMTELWAAYNFVNPNTNLRQQFKIDEYDTGLLAKSGDWEEEQGWEFAIHPAIAGTLIARDAMRLDMVIASHTRQLAALKLPDFQTYQWYDPVAILRAEDGLVRIQAATVPRHLLLRVRFWTNGLPRWAMSRQTMEVDSAFELRRRLIKETGGERQLRELATGARQRMEEEIGKQLNLERLLVGGGNVPFLRSPLLEYLSAEFDAFRRMEQFARTVSVLHWIADTCPDGLPPLPPEVQIQRFDIPAQMRQAEIRFVPASRFIPEIRR